MISLIDETHSSEGFVLQLQFDHESEITNLPSATRPFNRVNYAIAYDYGTPLAGSSAICLDSSKTYVFNANGTWNEGGTTVVSSFGGKTGDITLGDGLEMNGNEVRTTGGGLPTTANAGDAMVFNGTAWAKQDGYGYTTPESSVSIPWDGDTTGKETAFGGTLCKLTSDIPVNINNLIGGSVSIIIEGEPMSYTIGDTMLGPLPSEPAGMLYTVSDIILIALTDVTFEEEELLHKGIWFTKNDIMLVTNLTYGTPAVVHKIDTKYIPSTPCVSSLGGKTGAITIGTGLQMDGNELKATPVADPTVASAKATNGIGYTLSSSLNITWDGQQEGHEIVEGGEHVWVKVSDEYFSPEALVGATVTLGNMIYTLAVSDVGVYNNGGYEFQLNGDPYIVVMSKEYRMTLIWDVTFPSKGVWLMWNGDYVSSITKAGAASSAITSQYISTPFCRFKPFGTSRVSSNWTAQEIFDAVNAGKDVVFMIRSANSANYITRLFLCEASKDTSGTSPRYSFSLYDLHHIGYDDWTVRANNVTADTASFNYQQFE